MLLTYSSNILYKCKNKKAEWLTDEIISQPFGFFYGQCYVLAYVFLNKATGDSILSFAA